jgi:hypothetical protein
MTTLRIMYHETLVELRVVGLEAIVTIRAAGRRETRHYRLVQPVYDHKSRSWDSGVYNWLKLEAGSSPRVDL